MSMDQSDRLEITQALLGLWMMVHHLDKHVPEADRPKFSEASGKVSEAISVLLKNAREENRG